MQTILRFQYWESVKNKISRGNVIWAKMVHLVQFYVWCIESIPVSSSLRLSASVFFLGELREVGGIYTVAEKFIVQDSKPEQEPEPELELEGIFNLFNLVGTYAGEIKVIIYTDRWVAPIHNRVEEDGEEEEEEEEEESKQPSRDLQVASASVCFVAADVAAPAAAGSWVPGLPWLHWYLHPPGSLGSPGSPVGFWTLDSRFSRLPGLPGLPAPTRLPAFLKPITDPDPDPQKHHM
ncbi:hypothetical protein BZA77DRAFT_343573 [Pyronema omphalodes]|nr:hypothetical protein BZA77DRAFT_343573 [Pyronema omphalodes]